MHKKIWHGLISQIPISLSLFICGILLSFRRTIGKESNQSFTTSLVGENTQFKFQFFMFLVLLIFSVEILSKQKIIRFSQIIRISEKINDYELLSNRRFRFIFVLVSVNLLTWINLIISRDFAAKLFGIYRINPLYPAFADLQTTIYGIECNAVSEIGDYISCGDRGNSWLYPTALLKLRVFNLGLIDTRILMLIVLLLLTILIYKLLNHLNNSRFILSVSLLLTPPFVLNIERGNLDLFIFVLLSFSVYLLAFGSNSNNSIIISSLLISVSSFLKFYPIVAFFPLLLYSAIRKNKFNGISRLIVISVALVTFLGIFRDILESRRFGVYDHAGSYGLRNLYTLVNGQSDSRIFELSSLILSLLFLVFLYSRYLAEAENFYSLLDIRLRLSLLIISSISTAVWVLGTSYYYRLTILWIFIYLLLYAERTIFTNKSFIRLSVISTVLACILIPRTFAIIQNVLLVPIHLLTFAFITAELRQRFTRQAHY
jgi:hypothetical protein